MGPQIGPDVDMAPLRPGESNVPARLGFWSVRLLRSNAEADRHRCAATF